MIPRYFYEGFYQTLGVSFAFRPLYSFTAQEPRRMKGNSGVSGSWGLWGLATNICPLGKIEYWIFSFYYLICNGSDSFFTGCLLRIAASLGPGSYPRSTGPLSPSGILLAISLEYDLYFFCAFCLISTFQFSLLNINKFFQYFQI